MVTNDQLKEIEEQVMSLRGYLHLDQKKVEIANEEEKTADPLLKTTRRPSRS